MGSLIDPYGLHKTLCYNGNNNTEFIFNSETFVKATFVAKINVDSE